MNAEVFLAVCLQDRGGDAHSQSAGTAACMVTPPANQQLGMLDRAQGVRVIRV